MPPDDPGPEPLTPLAQGAAQIAELYVAYVRAGIPPLFVAFMLGTTIALLIQSAQPPE